MRDDNTRNTIIFVVCAVLLLLVYQVFVIDPQTKRRQAELARQAPSAAATQQGNIAAPQVPQAMTRQAAVDASPRVVIDTPSLTGSLSLRGARIDDLYLDQYRQTVKKGSPAVELLRPEGAQYPWFAEIGWVGQNVPGLPNAQTVWTLAEGSKLAPNQPIVLTYSNGQGLTFTRRIAVDERYMFTVTDAVANTTGQPVTLARYGAVQRQGVPADLGKNQIVHEGAIGWLDGKLRQVKYGKWQKEGGGPAYTSSSGWLGITDKYWLAAMIPGQGEQITGQFRRTEALGQTVLDANFVGPPRIIGAGQQVTETTHFFAGAKNVPLLRQYEKALQIDHFDNAVDWGNFWFLTRPIFQFLEFIHRHVGTFGLAILALTVVVRLLFFPLANKQYESLTKMKKVQPQMEELRKKYKDDPAKQQQELLALYQREKVNPLAGCLPLLLQIPVFYALYKVLTVTIEMRHAPFLGFIKDLSARDPTTIWNLFGLIPWNPGTLPLLGGFLDGPLHIGVVVILYGITMWLTTAMSPPAGDPIQQKIFQLMPLIFTFIMAPFAVGLIIYWTWSNVLTILQQYVIMRRFKVDNPIDQILRRLSGGGAAKNVG
ncbi:membrane protein insertase YidC [Phenylobacterium sp. J426]|uniref:membrane protein insertase YidC n=1 Tax=Phenylobacterium sp. J426 TaxID=2898439 RepID=UPI00215089CA|nr:membrane protein insertase YidC [Phenylobacterium sp. J426]MCR5873447.1 membrane protein insertase YidC [Phenylobacterium sp. J426]